MIRKIWLTNAEGSEKFEFTDFGDFIFTAPTSLGIYRQKSFLIVNNQRIEIEDVPSFKNITGTILIKGKFDELERKYNKLRDFISKNIKNGFRLYVMTTVSGNGRYIECSIDTLDKTEKATANTMLVPINILPKSLWLTESSGVSVSQSQSVSGLFRFGKVFNDIYGTRFVERQFTDEYGKNYYSMAFQGGTLSQAYIYNGGEETTPLVIRVYGVAVNPFIKLRDYNTGEILQSVKFNDLTISQGDYIEINSNPANTYMKLVPLSGGKIDIEDYADQETTMYINLPVGSYIIEVSDDTTNNVVQSRVFFTNQYKGA